MANDAPVPQACMRPRVPRVAATLLLLLASSCKPGCEELRARPPNDPPRSLAARRSCESGPWSTYGRDERRTSTSPGCCAGPLRELWRFTPETKAGRKASIYHAIVTSEAVFASGVLGESPALFRIGTDGQGSWTYDSRVDISHAIWPTWGHGHVILNDDGLIIADPDRGVKLYDRGLDSWGQTIADPSRLYLVNEWHVEGPRVLVGAYDPVGSAIWQQNVHGSVREDVKDVIGSIALDGGTLFQAAEYKFVPFSGVYAFDEATGAPQWRADVHPTSALSAGFDNVYLSERAASDGPETLVARSQKTGELVWNVPVQGLDGAAPAVTSELVLTFSHQEGLSAWNATTGQAVWTQWIAGSAKDTPANDTHIAIAAGSETVIVAIGSTMTVRALSDGQELWHGESEQDGGATHLHSPIIAYGRVYAVTDGELRAWECAPEVQ